MFSWNSFQLQAIILSPDESPIFANNFDVDFYYVRNSVSNKVISTQKLN